jgi:hypothetical protein
MASRYGHDENVRRLGFGSDGRKEEQARVQLAFFVDDFDKTHTATAPICGPVGVGNAFGRAVRGVCRSFRGFEGGVGASKSTY